MKMDKNKIGESCMNTNQSLSDLIQTLNKNVLLLLKEFRAYTEEEKERYRVGKQFLDVNLQSINNNICACYTKVKSQ